ncbi:transcription elongation regulator 1-like [Planoprotostelium fungivorum]|uniref:Transcription elongation regulator 1-like n=1 Tax=Planoprotostelium fungivorum TaxID=1890364 RepID=A0A2P6NXA5_9EUKA|nr:transcription elongation regulator 1-like [Planoprotostelium fungivorum]
MPPPDTAPGVRPPLVPAANGQPRAPMMMPAPDTAPGVRPPLMPKPDEQAPLMPTPDGQSRAPNMMPAPDSAPGVRPPAPMMPTPDEHPNHTAPTMPAADGQTPNSTEAPAEQPPEPVEEEEWIEFVFSGHYFYYNWDKSQASWIRPPQARREQPKLRPLLIRKTMAPLWRIVSTNLGYEYFYNVETKEATWLQPYELMEGLEMNAEAPPPEPTEEEKHENVKKRLLAEEEEQRSKFAKTEQEDDQGLTFEERVEIFKTMLKEKNIEPFSTWDKELPKIVLDPRFKILPNHADRRSIFTHYVKTKLEQDKKEKIEKTALAKDTIYATLKAENGTLSATLSFEDFKAKFGSAQTFKNLTSKEKERLYNELLDPIKKATEKKTSAEKEKETKGLMDLLKENNKITSKTSYIDACDLLDATKDKRNQTPHLSTTEREEIYKKHTDKLGDQERKKQREEASKKERERVVAAMKEKEEKERSKIIRRYNQDDELIAFKTLLKEKVKDPEVSWRTARQSMEHDARFRVDSISSLKKEDLFRDHKAELVKLQLSNYRQLLRETFEKGRINLRTKDFNDARSHIKDDARYEVLYSDDRRSQYALFMEELKVEAFGNLQKLFAESKAHGVINQNTPSSGEKYEKLVELMEMDKRWMDLVPFRKERDEALVRYIDEFSMNTIR